MHMVVRASFCLTNLVHLPVLSKSFYMNILHAVICKELISVSILEIQHLSGWMKKMMTFGTFKRQSHKHMNQGWDG